MKRSFLIIGVSVVAMLLAGCARADFSVPVDLPAISAAFQDVGLQICEQDDLDWSVTPGFVEGKYFIVGADCSTYAGARPAARVVAARFDSLAARDSALRDFETTYRRHIGAGMARGVGSWVIAVDGEQMPGTAMRLREAIVQLAGE